MKSVKMLWIIAILIMLAACMSADALVSDGAPIQTPTNVGGDIHEDAPTLEPVATPTLEPTSTPEPTPELVPTLELTPSPITASLSITYVVQSGDTLSGIAKQYNTDVEILQIDNNILDSRLLQIGQVLTVCIHGVLLVEDTVPTPILPPTPEVCVESTSLSAKGYFDGTSFRICNRDCFDWLDVELVINGDWRNTNGWKYEIPRIGAGTDVTIKAYKFTQANGKKFCTLVYAPKTIHISAKTLNGGSATYYGRWPDK